MQDLNILGNQHPYSKKVYPGEDIVKRTIEDNILGNQGSTFSKYRLE